MAEHRRFDSARAHAWAARPRAHRSRGRGHGPLFWHARSGVESEHDAAVGGRGATGAGGGATGCCCGCAPTGTVMMRALAIAKSLLFHRMENVLLVHRTSPPISRQCDRRPTPRCGALGRSAQRSRVLAPGGRDEHEHQASGAPRAPALAGGRRARRGGMRRRRPRRRRARAGHGLRGPSHAEGLRRVAAWNPAAGRAASGGYAATSTACYASRWL